MGEWFESQAAAGSLALAVPVALIAGLVSFFSPCVIPLLPGYLSYATGLSGADLADINDGRRNAPRGRMLRRLGPLRARLRGGVRPGRRRVRQRRVLAAQLAGRDHDRARPGPDPARARVRRRGAVAPAGLADPQDPCGRARRRSVDRRAVRDRLDALHRPDVRRHPQPHLHRRDRGPRSAALALLRARAGDPVHRRRPRLSPYPRRRRVGTAAPGLGDADRRRVPRPARARHGHRAGGTTSSSGCSCGWSTSGRPPCDATSTSARSAGASSPRGSWGGGSGARSPRCAPRWSCCSCLRWPPSRDR